MLLAMNVVDFGGPIGNVTDRDGRTGRLAVRGEIGFAIVQTGAFELDEQETVSRVREAALYAIEHVLRDALARGAVDLADLAILPSMIATAVEQRMPAAPGVPHGMRFRLERLVLLPLGDEAPAELPPGTSVLVTWADGNAYPGVVREASGQQRRVELAGGEMRWVDLRWLRPA
jgi:hypothetical protein